MMKLYEIDEEILSCIDLETGEVIDEKKLNDLEMERDAKVEGVILWIKSLLAESKAIKEEKQALEKRQKIAENKAESLKNWVAYALNGQKFSTPKCTVSYRKSVSVDITDLNQILLLDNADDYLTYEEPKANKTAIKEAILHGVEIKGATLVEKNNIQIK